MWTTTLCHPSAFVKLSVTMASLPHRNCPSDSQVYIAMGSRTLRGSRAGKKGGKGGREGDTGVRGKKADWGRAESGGETARESEKENERNNL